MREATGPGPAGPKGGQACPGPRVPHLQAMEYGEGTVRASSHLLQAELGACLSWGDPVPRTPNRRGAVGTPSREDGPGPGPEPRRWPRPRACPARPHPQRGRWAHDAAQPGRRAGGRPQAAVTPPWVAHAPAARLQPEPALPPPPLPASSDASLPQEPQGRHRSLPGGSCLRHPTHWDEVAWSQCRLQRTWQRVQPRGAGAWGSALPPARLTRWHRRRCGAGGTSAPRGGHTGISPIRSGPGCLPRDGSLFLSKRGSSQEPGWGGEGRGASARGCSSRAGGRLRTFPTRLPHRPHTCPPAQATLRKGPGGSAVEHRLRPRL